jgi:hypothetical protein
LTTFTSGVYLALAAVLIVASLIKARQLARFELALVRLAGDRIWQRLPVTSRGAARIVCVIEFATGVSLLVASGTGALAARAWTAGLFAGFAVISVIAMRLQTPCGCHGAQSRVKGADAARSLGIAAMAAAAAVGSAVLPSSAVGQRFGLGPVLLGVGLACLALWPVLLHSAALVRISVGTHGRGEAAAPISAPSRRTFLKGAVGTLGALIAVSALGTPALAHTKTYHTCQQAFDRCYGCTTKLRNKSDVQCCIDCYVSCQGGGGSKCYAGISCDGCWPGRYF